MPTTLERRKALQTLGQMMEDIRVGMLTTVLPDGTLRSRPMAPVRREFDGDLWFFTNAHTPKVDEVQSHPQVSVAFAEPRTRCYLSISGTGSLVRDRKKMEVLWHSDFEEWIPQGLDDPELTLLRVDVEQAEYWDERTSTMVHIGDFLRSVVTGQRPSHAGHEKIDWHAGPSPIENNVEM
jgi:general stress protein 26